MIPGTWVNRAGRYPYVSRETWWTRYWLLVRKVPVNPLRPTHHDRRTAAILRTAAQRLDLPSSPRGSAADEYLQEIIHG